MYALRGGCSYVGLNEAAVRRALTEGAGRVGRHVALADIQKVRRNHDGKLLEQRVALFTIEGDNITENACEGP